MEKIPMYWWEGFYGFNHVCKRLLKGKKTCVRNFGDFLSPLIVSILANKNVHHTISANKLMALGSIFFALNNHDRVWGSGFLNAKHIKFARACRDVTYLAVRGPETRNLLLKNHIDCPEIYGDPALLLPALIYNDIPKKYKLGIVPHFSQYQYFKKIIKDKNSIVIDVEENVIKVVQTILACDIILSTSLHGLIVAEAYGIPSLMVVLGKPSTDDLFKFEDYFHATDRTLSYAEFEKYGLKQLSDLALKQPKLQFNYTQLLRAFPFKNINLNLSLPRLKWNSLHNIDYQVSIIPPKFFLSSS